VNQFEKDSYQGVASAMPTTAKGKEASAAAWFMAPGG
jgi:hypothetical protein